MDYQAKGKIMMGIGGIYYVKTVGSHVDGRLLPCRARGKFRHEGITPLVGDNVEIVYNDRTVASLDSGLTEKPEATEVMIAEIIDRRNALIRPPLANLDILFVSMASASPAPDLPTVDKLISVAEYNGIEPVIVIGKNDLNVENAEKIQKIYRGAGFTVFSLSAKDGEGLSGLVGYLQERLAGKIAAFAGASGVGKSSLMNRLFPERHLETGAVSEKTERGRNTTRHVELFEYDTEKGVGYIADTPGFSLLDFVRFDFFGKDDLPKTLREFRPYLGKCRYKKCTHTKEEGCAILDALRHEEIARSRHESFLAMYSALKDKPDWNKGKAEK